MSSYCSSSGSPFSLMYRDPPTEIDDGEYYYSSDDNEQWLPGQINLGRNRFYAPMYSPDHDFRNPIDMPFDYLYNADLDQVEPVRKKQKTE